MTTLPLRDTPRNPFADAFAQLGAAIDAFFEVFEEAQALARAADKQHPFMEG